jgi:hypothetical protein
VYGVWLASSELASQLPDYLDRLAQLTERTSDKNKAFILEELRLWAESIMPVDD